MAIILLYMFSATVAKLKFSEISNFHDIKKLSDICDHKLNFMEHLDRVLKTHENGTNGIPIHKDPQNSCSVLSRVVTIVHPQKE